MSRMISLSRVVLLTLVVGASCAMAVSVRAQDQDISQYISSSNVDAGVGEINQYARTHLADLRSSDSSTRAAAREALRDPLSDPMAPSVAFRLAYHTALSDSLQAMIDGDDPVHAINAIYLMGDLGTSDAKNSLLAELASDDESIRYASATALRQTMEIIDTGRSVISNEQSIIDAMLQAMQNETNVLIIDALVRALEPLRSSPDLRNASNIAICQGVVTYFRSRGTNPDAFQDAQTLLRALVTLRRTHIALVGGVNRTLGLETGALAGQAMAELSSILQDGDLDESLLDLAGDGLVAAEALAGLANVSLNGPPISNQDVNRAVDSIRNGGNVDAIGSAVNVWIGPTGLLTRAPFNLNDADFAQ